MCSTIFGAAPTPVSIPKIGAGSPHAPHFQKGAFPAPNSVKKKASLFQCSIVKTYLLS